MDETDIASQESPLKHHHIFYGVLVVLGLAIIIGGLWLAYYSLDITSDTPLMCPADAKICPDGTSVSRTGPQCLFPECPTDDEFADWKLYQNDEYKFSLRYPASLTFKRDGEHYNPYTQEFITDYAANVPVPLTFKTVSGSELNGEYLFSGGVTYVPGFIAVRRKPDNYENLATYVGVKVNEIEVASKGSATGVNITAPEEVKIGGLSGYEFEWYGLSVMRNANVEIYIERGQYIFHISYEYAGGYIDNPGAWDSAPVDDQNIASDKQLKYSTIKKVISTLQFQ